MKRWCENWASSKLGMVRSVDWGRQARADIKKLSKRTAFRIERAVRRLADTGQGDFKRLQGVEPPTHRLRVGSWRVIIELEANVIRIKRVFHRREAYRKTYWARQELPEPGDVGESAGAEASWDSSD